MINILWSHLKCLKYFNVSLCILFSTIEMLRKINYKSIEWPSCLFVIWWIKLYLTKFSEREPENIQMRCINIHSTVNPFTFNKLLYMLITFLYYTWLLQTFRIKRCTIKWVFSVQILRIFIMFSRIDKTRTKFNNVK